MQWINPFNDKDISEYFGFIYLITNKTTGMWYVGKKQFKFKTKLAPKKGKVNKRIIFKDSDWADYWSSSSHVHADVLKYGMENFERKIIALCKTKVDLSYSELECQILLNAVACNTCYNGALGQGNLSSMHSGIERCGLDWIDNIPKEIKESSPLYNKIKSS